MKQNRKHKKFLQRIRSLKDDGILFNILGDLPGVRHAEHSSGYYGKVEAVLYDGHRCTRWTRDYDHTKDYDAGAIRDCIKDVLKYSRRPI